MQCPACSGTGMYQGEECFECDGEGFVCENCGEPLAFCDGENCQEEFEVDEDDFEDDD